MRLWVAGGLPSLAALVAAGASPPPPASPVPAANVYATQCQICHGATGDGQPGQFPKLAGRVSRIAATPAGRAYLIDVVLGGMAGRIVVEGRPIVGVMPSYATLGNAELASALTFAARLGGGSARPFSAAEIAAGRLRAPTTARSRAARDALVAIGQIS